jgi:hypothetical protein
MNDVVAGAGGPPLLEPGPHRSWSPSWSWCHQEPVSPAAGRWCPTRGARVSPAAGAVGTIGTRKTRAWVAGGLF